MSRRPWMMAHPKRHDDLLIVRDAIVGALVIFGAIVAASMAPV